MVVPSYYVVEGGSERSTTWGWSEPPDIGDILEGLFEAGDRRQVVSYDPAPYVVSPYRVVKGGYFLVRPLKEGTPSLT